MARIVITSEFFLPSIGGVERIVEILAKEFTRMGHEVTVLTSQSDAIPGDDSYCVIRRRSWFTPWFAFRFADAIVHFGGIRLGWPGCFISRKMLRVRQNWPAKSGPLRHGLERLLSSRCVEVAPSDSVGRAYAKEFVKIPNPYDSDCFQGISGEARTLDLVFLGRLRREKGADLILEALVDLRNRGLKPSLSIVGEGSELEILKANVQTYALGGQVRFLGPLSGDALIRELNRHRILVVPSRWDEPFGIVALEGIACGCAVIGSNGGGLPDAIGRCGLLFPNGNVEELAACIERLLKQPDLMNSYRQAAPAHLEQHQANRIARQYLAALESRTGNHQRFAKP